MMSPGTLSVGTCIAANAVTNYLCQDAQVSKGQYWHTTDFFRDSQGQIECFAAVSAMLPRHAVVCLLVRVM